MAAGRSVLECEECARDGNETENEQTHKRHARNQAGLLDPVASAPIFHDDFPPAINTTERRS